MLRLPSLASCELSTTLWLGACILLLAYFYRKLKKGQLYWEERGVKYLKPKLILGNLELISSKAFADHTVDLYNNFPEERYHGIFQFLQPTLVIKDADLIKEIGVKQFDSFMDHRQFVPPEVDPMWNKNLFATTGEQWRDMRTTLSPSFTSSKMRMLFVLMEECVWQFVDYFKNNNGTIELEMKDVCSRYANDVIATTAFGLECDSLKEKTNDFYVMGKGVTDLRGIKAMKFFLILISPVLCKILKLKVISTSVANYFTNIIKETVKTREERNIVRPDMIHLLMEARKKRSKQELDEIDPMVGGNKKEITIDDIAAQAFVFFVAGFDTSSTLFSFTFYELAVNPEIQAKLREEVNSVFNGGKITYEQLQSMKYLDMVLAETLRKWTPTVIVDRVVTKPFTIQPVKPGEKPVQLELGTICWFPLFALHRDPKFFPQPTKFDPERFSEENKPKIDPSTYIPFGIGPRNCIGSRFVLMEAKLLIVHVLACFEIVPVKRTNIPMVLNKQLFLESKGGMWLGFKRL